MKNIWLVLLPCFVLYGGLLFVMISEIVTKGKHILFYTVFCIGTIAYFFISAQNVLLFQDLIEKETEFAVGECVKYERSTFTAKIYFENEGESFVMYMPAYSQKRKDMEKGKTYEIEYFENSRVIKEFKLIE